MKKKIFFIISGLILACLIFYSGVYFGQKTSSLERTQLDLSYYFSGRPPGGYALIKEIDTDNSTITLASQTSKDENLKARLSTATRFYQAIKKENGKIGRESIELKDLKIDDRVYFIVRTNQDGSLTLLFLTVGSTN